MQFGSPLVDTAAPATSPAFSGHRLPLRKGCVVVPDRQFAFLIATSGPYQEGQTAINGVYFSPEHAGPMLKSMADEQAKAITARQHAEQRKKA
jgi:hypothetical protein